MTDRTASELIAIARNAYYRDDEIALVADVDEQVVRPLNFVDPRGCVAVEITPNGGWQEGWWSPDRPFRASL